MTTTEWLLAAVTVVSLLFAIVSFGVFVKGSLSALQTLGKTADASTTVANAALAASTRPDAGQAAGGNNFALGVAVAPSITDLTALVNALNSAFSSFNKASPAMAGLIAAILFVFLAAWASTPRPAATAQIKCTIENKTAIPIQDGKATQDVPVKCG